MPRIDEDGVAACAACRDLIQNAFDLEIGASEIDAKAIGEVSRAAVHETVARIESAMFDVPEVATRCRCANLEVTGIVACMSDLIDQLGLGQTQYEVSVDPGDGSRVVLTRGPLLSAGRT